ncbi:mitochondrial adenyl nucleotide antiporter SLC25A25-like isoform X1 [Littorina saxatilis]|uniref:EF-hand domain-containing protein n=1 Tax=Littorina saxatilis TaxID=31220 RepID=A0AAN9G543_9CAEN
MSSGNSDDQHPPLSVEEQQKLQQLFEQLDVNKDGSIDIDDLTRAMESMQVPHVPGHAQRLFKKYDKDEDEHINFTEFVKYVQDHERELRLQFKNIDTNDDGSIDAGEIVESFKKLGVSIDPAEAKRLLKRMDKDGTLKIDWNEWRNYLILSPSANLQDILHYWRHSSVGPPPCPASSPSSSFFPVHICQFCLAKVRRVLHVVRLESICVTHAFPVQRVPWPMHVDWEWDHSPHPLAFEAVQSYQPEPSHLHDIIDIGENSLVPDDFTEKELLTGMWWRHLVAGGGAGAVSRTCTAPLDRLKVLLQVHGSSKNNLTITSGFKQMLEEGGVKSLWRGNGMNVIKIAPESAIKFMAYEQVKTWVKGDQKEITVVQRLFSGSAAGAISQTTIYPMEVMKTRLALRKTGEYSSMFDCARKIAKKEGLRSFYRGYIPNLLGIIPYAGIDLCVYETLKKLYMSKHKNQDPGIFVLLGCGTVSSTCGQLSSYPLALVRTRLQAKGGSKDTMVGLFTKILREDGPFGLYRGIAPNFLKVAPAVSISYVVYEQIRKSLGVTMS